MIHIHYCRVLHLHLKSMHLKSTNIQSRRNGIHVLGLLCKHSVLKSYLPTQDFGLVAFSHKKGASVQQDPKKLSKDPTMA